MTALFAELRDFAYDEAGATAIEYGLIGALIAIGILIALTAMGGSVTDLYGYVNSRSSEQLDNADIN